MLGGRRALVMMRYWGSDMCRMIMLRELMWVDDVTSLGHCAPKPRRG
jgi:hypothetical protein